MNNEQLVSYILDTSHSKGDVTVAYARSIRDATIPADKYGFVNSAITGRWSHSSMLTIKRNAWRLIEEGRLFG